jgi:membrane protease YdiL (CAAX protease family)
VYSGLPPLGLPAIVLLVLLFNGFGEETGWRGFALEPLQARFGPVTGTLVLAALWAGWHAASSRSSRKKADTSERLRGPDLRYTIKACKG